MPRIIRLLWFEDISLPNEPFLDTPFGRLSPRQVLIILLFAIPAWLVASNPPPFIEDPVAGWVAGGLVFMAGVMLAFKKVKTVPPEKLLLATLRPPVGLGRKPSRRLKRIEVYVDIESPSPVRLVGVLRDSTGRPMRGISFTVKIDGREAGGGVTDEEGFYSIQLVPEEVRPYRVVVEVDGEVVDEVEVEVRGRVG